MINKNNNKFYNNKLTKRKYKYKSALKKISITIILLTIIYFITNEIPGNNKLVAGNVVSSIELNQSPLDNEEIISQDENRFKKGSNVNELGYEYAIDAKNVKDMVDGKYEGTEKYVFLTFDDGPSPNTETILDVLNEKGVKATFFVLGQNLEGNIYSQELLKRTFEEGHAIANHSYSHNLEKLYPNNSIDVNYFMEEFNKTNDLIRSIIGENFDTKVLRMPGGYNSREYYNDPSLPLLDNILEENNIVSIDWNALNGDAEGIDYSTSEMLDYAKRTTGNNNHVILLMHDTYGKEKTAEMLPALIDFYKSNGYEFKTIK